MKRLEGKTALVTSAARGSGAQIARRFMEAGARVFINDLNINPARQTATAIGAEALACDVSDPDSVTAMFKELREGTDCLDILVNNAGISGLEGDNDARARIQGVAVDSRTVRPRLAFWVSHGRWLTNWPPIRSGSMPLLLAGFTPT